VSVRCSAITLAADRFFLANPYEIMVTDGKVHDVDEFDWDRWCEYIMYRGASGRALLAHRCR
jgi:hypothetical protein